MVITQGAIDILLLVTVICGLLIPFMYVVTILSLSPNDKLRVAVGMPPEGRRTLVLALVYVLVKWAFFINETLLLALFIRKFL